MGHAQLDQAATSTCAGTGATQLRKLRRSSNTQAALGKACSQYVIQCTRAHHNNDAKKEDGNHKGSSGVTYTIRGFKGEGVKQSHAWERCETRGHQEERLLESEASAFSLGTEPSKPHFSRTSAQYSFALRHNTRSCCHFPCSRTPRANDPASNLSRMGWNLNLQVRTYQELCMETRISHTSVPQIKFTFELGWGSTRTLKAND